MFDYIIKKLEPLLDMIVDPLMAWLRKRSLTFKICLSGAAAVLIAMMYYGYTLNWVAEKALYVPRVAFSNTSTIPFSSDVVARTKRIKRRLASTVADDLSELANGDLTPWSAAQAVVSVSGVAQNLVEIVEFINSKHAPDCECWAETPDRLRAFRNPFISGWIFYALADIGIPVSQGALDILLSEQQE